MISRRDALSLLGSSAVALGPGRVLAQAGTRAVTDAAGRKVTIPAKIGKVFAAGTPAAITLYTLAPDLLAGWPDPIQAARRAYLPAKYAALPVTGRLTGRANTANVEAVLAAKPDLVIDIGTIAPIYASLADRVQQQTGIPYVLLDGALTKTPALYRQLGNILGASAEAESHATYAADLLALVKSRISYVPRTGRARVYYARGPEGLETGLAGSINAEMLEFVGADKCRGHRRKAQHRHHLGRADSGLEPGGRRHDRPTLLSKRVAQSDLGGCRRGAIQARVPGAGQAVRLVRFAARGQPADRAQMAVQQALSRPVFDGFGGGNA